MATYPSPTLDNLTVQGAASLGSSAAITGGTIDGTAIGNTTPASVKATTINSSSAATLNSVSTANATLTGGTINGVVIGGTNPANATVVNLTASGTVSGTGITNLLSPYLLSANLASTATGEGASLIGWPSGYGISQPATNQFFSQQGAAINRINERLFLAGGTVADGAYPPVTNDWLSTYQDTLGYSNSVPQGMFFVATNDSSSSAVGATFGARSLTATSAGQSCIGGEAFAINNNATLATNAWGFYAEAHRVTSAAGSVYGMEVDTLTETQSVTPTPFQQGDVVGHQIGAGAGVLGMNIVGSISGNTLTVTSITPNLGFQIAVGTKIYGAGVTAATDVTALGTGTGGTGTYTVNNSQTVSSRNLIASNTFEGSAAIQIVNNLVPWQMGINFTAQSITGCDGVNGTGIAIGLASGHMLQWYGAGGVQTSKIISTGTVSANSVQLNFGDGDVYLQSRSNGTINFSFNVQDTNVNGIDFYGGATGVAPQINANGSDANIDLRLNTKGSGVVWIGEYTAGAPTATGYIAVKDSTGTIRHLLCA